MLLSQYQWNFILQIPFLAGKDMYLKLKKYLFSGGAIMFALVLALELTTMWYYDMDYGVIFPLLLISGLLIMFIILMIYITLSRNLCDFECPHCGKDFKHPPLKTEINDECPNCWRGIIIKTDGTVSKEPHYEHDF